MPAPSARELFKDAKNLQCLACLDRFCETYHAHTYHTTHHTLLTPTSAPHLFEINKISQLPHAHFASFCKLSYAFRSSDITTASHEPALDRCNSSSHICHCAARPNHKQQIASHCLLAEQYLPLIIQMCVWVYIT